MGEEDFKIREKSQYNHFYPILNIFQNKLVGFFHNLIFILIFYSFSRALGMHFHEVHPEEVEVPKCNLCMQELLTNARLTEKYGEDFGVTLPDEHTYRSIRFKRDFKSEVALEKGKSPKK